MPWKKSTSPIEGQLTVTGRQTKYTQSGLKNIVKPLSTSTGNRQSKSVALSGPILATEQMYRPILKTKESSGAANVLAARQSRQSTSVANESHRSGEGNPRRSSGKPQYSI